MSYRLTHEYDGILEDLLKNQLGLEYIINNGVAVGIVASDKEKVERCTISALSFN